jgi:hemolysin III
MLMVAGGIVLLPLALARGPVHFWACLAFLVTGFLVFFASAVYHFLSDGYESSPRLELLLDNLDHSAIYLFIAGTYTPFILNAAAPPWRLPLIIAVWCIAFFGIAYTLVKPRLPQLLQSRAVYTSLFVLMGCFMAVRLNDVVTHLHRSQIYLLIAGGLAYILGAVGYATKRPRLLVGFFGFHELWHVMVLLGATLHYLMIFSIYDGKP